MEFEQYNTKMSVYASKVCKFLTIKLIGSAQTLAVYVKTGELESVYLGLENTLKALEFKRLSVGAKN